MEIKNIIKRKETMNYKEVLTRLAKLSISNEYFIKLTLQTNDIYEVNDVWLNIIFNGLNIYDRNSETLMLVKLLEYAINHDFIKLENAFVTHDEATENGYFYHTYLQVYVKPTIDIRIDYHD